MIIKADKNLQKFFGAYLLLYGTFMTLSALSNQMLKPYGFLDKQIAILGVLMIFSGVAGAIYFTNLIKKTRNYEKVIKKVLLLSMIFMVLYTMELNLLSYLSLTALLATLLGFHLAPIIPISYDLGCELSFPIS